MALTTARFLPRSTYRFQLHQHFPFAAVEGLVAYLDDLGISDCYLSPIFTAAPGSMHGYDVNDPTQVSPELGGEAGFDALARALSARGMGSVLDFVPNHMGIMAPFNPWWLDVLKNGKDSEYAGFFDIEWHPQQQDLQEKVLVPVLEDQYGRVLESGKLRLEWSGKEFQVRYRNTVFPLRPESQERLRGMAPSPREVVTRVNGREGNAGSFDLLHGLLEEQHYRLAFWQAGAHEINYRRFFAIDTLIGLHVEDPAVMRASHEKLMELIARGEVRGVRIDHIDGLWNPTQYLADFHTLCAPSADGRPDYYLVVEKILALEEKLPSTWAVQGTTGYDFIAQLASILVDPHAMPALSETFTAFTGIEASAEEVIYEKKRLVLGDLFADTVDNLAISLDHIVEFDRRWRDLTLHDLRVAIRETMACLGVYRTYRRPGVKMGDADALEIERACDGAKRRNPTLNPVPFEFVRDALQGKYVEHERARAHGLTVEWWTLKFQQATGAVMAKSVEDTAFFVFNRLYALNEVGCDPGTVGGTIAEFHAWNAYRLREIPHSMLATSTHDTKMSEDVRARLYAISERPGHWREVFATWAMHNQKFKAEKGHAKSPDPSGPDANEEFLLYQMLLGAWPIGGLSAAPDFLERMKSCFRKAIHEAKTNTTWNQPNERWIESCDRFLERLLDPAGGFPALFEPEAEALAFHGAINSLTQVTLKITCPGIPDFYQGSEAWDFSLVDPDNRRPVDFAARKEIAAKLTESSPAELLSKWRNGAIKMYFIRTLLRFRREEEALFQQGNYQPIAVHGVKGEHAVAFTRTHGGKSVLVVVPRLPLGVGIPPLGEAWEETTLQIDLPDGARDVLSGQIFAAMQKPRVGTLLSTLPCAVIAF